QPHVGASQLIADEEETVDGARPEERACQGPDELDEQEVAVAVIVEVAGSPPGPLLVQIVLRGVGAEKPGAKKTPTRRSPAGWVVFPCQTSPLGVERFGL